MKPSFKIFPVILLLIYICFSAVSSCSEEEPLWYTLQAGSFSQQEEAEALFNILAAKLPTHSQDQLRIEFVKPKYTVRIGKFASRQEAVGLLDETKKLKIDGIILSAHIKYEGLIKTLSSSGIPPAFDSSQAPLSIQTNTQESPHKPVPEPTDTDSKKIRGPKDSPTHRSDKFPSVDGQSRDDSLWYTVQIGSFTEAQEAEVNFAALTKKLPAHLKKYLRIEFVKPYYAIRIGKFSSHNEGVKLLDETKKLKIDGIILSAHIKNERLVKLFTPSGIRTSLEPSPDVHPAPKERQRPRQKVSINDKNEAIKTQISKVTAQTPPVLTTQKKSTITDDIPLIKTPAPFFSPQEYEKMVLTKYLDIGSHDKDILEARKQLAQFQKTPNCITSACHDTLANVNTPHAPAKEAKCEACHVLIAEGHPSNSVSFKLKTDGAKLCYQCHINIINAPITHAPAQEGECSTCHNPHGSEHSFLLNVSKNNEQQLCFECHDQSLVDHQYTHGPVSMGSCTQCHNPHASSHKSLLKTDPQELCLTCHSDFITGLEKSKYIHTAMKQQGCQSCHAVHGSEHPNLLSQELREFCVSCHSEIKEKLDKSKVKHSALYLERQCRTCHLAHYSDHKNLLIKEEMDLCLSCHNSAASIGSFSPADLESELRNKEFIHAPVANGECTKCHDQHGAQNDKLLKAKYPSTFYEPYSPEKYALCFICHPEGLLTDQQTTDKTKFRNGQQNLHYSHVAIEQKGRTCQACHRSHASDGPKLISSAGATFGAWTMSIDLTITETGGSCMPGCHRTLSYDRETPSKYSKKDEDFGNSFIDYQSK